MKVAARWFAGCAVAIALTGCHAPADGAANKSASAPMELKIYDVPPAKTDVLRAALSEVLEPDKAKVSMPAPGKLMVYAARGAQPSIEQALSVLSKSSPENQINEHLQVRFWIVDSIPGDGADDSALKELAAPLGSLRQSLGSVHFILDEQSASAVDENRDAMLSTGHARRFNFFARPADDHDIELRIEYIDETRQGINQLKTTVSVQPGQYTVLAQAPAACPAANPKILSTLYQCQSKQGLRLLVVRVDRMNPKT